MKANPMYDAHTHVGSDMFLAMSGVTPESFNDLGGLVEDMDRIGIDRSVVLPQVGTLYFNPFVFRSEERLERMWTSSGSALLIESMNAPYALENELLFEGVYQRGKGLNGRILPFAAIHPSIAVENQVRNLRGLGNLGKVYGLKCHPTFMRTDVRRLLDEGKHLLDFAKEGNIPILIHSAVLPADQWARPEYILEVAEARPDIRIALAHMARFDRDVLERARTMHNAFVDTAGFMTHVKLAQKDHPGVKESEKRFRTDYNKPTKVMYDLVTQHPGTILFGTDNPAHYWIEVHQGVEFAEVNTLVQEAAPFKALPPELQREISCYNTEKFLFGSKISP